MVGHHVDAPVVHLIQRLFDEFHRAAVEVDFVLARELEAQAYRLVLAFVDAVTPEHQPVHAQ